METNTTVDDTIDETTTTTKYKAVEINHGKILLIPLRRIDDQDYLLLSDIQAMVPTATALVSDGKMIPFEIDTKSMLELSPKRVLVKETNVIWQVYSPDPPPLQQRTTQLEHKFDLLIQRLDQLVLSSTSSTSSSSTTKTSSSSSSLSDQLQYHQENTSPGSVTEVDTADLMSIDHYHHHHHHHHQSQSGPPTSSISAPAPAPAPAPIATTSSHRSASPPPAFSPSPCPVIPNTTHTTDVAANTCTTTTTSSAPSSPISASSHITTPQSPSCSSSPPPLETTSILPHDNTMTNNNNNNNMAGPSTSTLAPDSHHQQQPHDLTAAPPPSYETSIFGTLQTLTQHIRTFEHHIPNRHKSPRWLARRAGWVEYEPTTIEQVAYQLVQLEMALLWTAVTESWIQERETWLTLVASARTERHLAGALVNLERHTLVMDDAWQEEREAWTRDLLEVIVSVGF